MGRSVKKLPSINVPFVDSNGRMHPIWYEYFRSFISGATETSNSNGDITSTVVADGQGLVYSADGITLNVGNGDAIEVNANDVNVNVTNLPSTQAALIDEILVSKPSNNNAIQKSTVKSIVDLAGSVPGGSNTEVQYNNNGLFDGDSGMTTDGAGTVDISTQLTANDITLGKSGGLNRLLFGSSAVSNIRFDNKTGTFDPRIQSDGFGGYTLFADQSSGTRSLYFRSSGPPWMVFTLDTGNTISMRDGDNGGVHITGECPVRRCTDNNNTASTTQTQGQGALTGDYNVITTVANDDDTVTLPDAFEGRYCTVINNGDNRLQIFPGSGDDLGEGTNTATSLNPGLAYTWVGISGTTWHLLSGDQKRTIESGISASTTQSQGQGPITKDVNEVSTVANANDTVTLPNALTYARYCTIINNGANTLQIFPASGDDLGAGVDTSTTLASGSNITFVNYDATHWVQI